jgi:hypothetical protein
MKLIELSQGRVAIVDDEDFDWLSAWKWHYHRRKGAITGYARRTDRKNGDQRTIQMHNEIYHHYHRESFQELDHINTCGCDNRKSNIRLATRSANCVNKQRRSDNTSNKTGVTWYRQDQKWVARLQLPGKRLYLGGFVKKKDAIAARRHAEIAHFKEYRHNPRNLCPLWKTRQCPDCAKRASTYGLKEETNDECR